MSADSPPGQWVPPGGDPAPAGLRPGLPHAGAGMWVGGPGPGRRGPPPPRPPAPGGLGAGLAGPPAAPLHAAAAAVTAAGWATAAAVLADTLVAGHPVAGPSDVALASAIALPVVDLL